MALSTVVAGVRVPGPTGVELIHAPNIVQPQGWPAAAPDSRRVPSPDGEIMPEVVEGSIGGVDGGDGGVDGGDGVDGGGDGNGAIRPHRPEGWVCQVSGRMRTKRAGVGFENQAIIFVFRCETVLAQQSKIAAPSG